MKDTWEDLVRKQEETVNDKFIERYMRWVKVVICIALPIPIFALSVFFLYSTFSCLNIDLFKGIYSFSSSRIVDCGIYFSCFILFVSAIYSVLWGVFKN